MRRSLLPCLSVACLFAACLPAHALELVPLWTLADLPNPESVALAADGTTLYVSNVDGEGDARDGKGGIARVSLDGTMIDPHWVSGLDAPKGMALAGDRLFVSDITALVEIDVASGRIVARHDVPGSGFLNDTAIAPDGAVLVGDSARSRIHAWRDGEIRTWLEHELLAAVNGLLPEPDRLVACTMQGRLLAIDWTSKEIAVLAEGLGDCDGVAALGDGAYLASEWPGRVFRVDATGAVDVVLDTRAEGVYLNDFLLIGDRLYLPNLVPGALRAYRLSW